MAPVLPYHVLILFFTTDTPDFFTRCSSEVVFFLCVFLCPHPTPSGAWWLLPFVLGGGGRHVLLGLNLGLPRAEYQPFEHLPQPHKGFFFLFKWLFIGP